ncbi:NADH-quinone oxidoreductase subunit D [Pseudomonas chlororaphis subsp. aurantiaca]|nr:NADH-quinone oxidoreductase subunit D [Pseudomonas chlororaphis subsp. aurantiaca]
MGGDETVDVHGVVGQAELFEQGGQAVGWGFHGGLLNGSEISDDCRAVDRGQPRSCRNNLQERANQQRVATGTDGASS